MIKDYIKDAYPYWIREESNELGSITNKYDEVRGFTFDTISDEIISAAKQLLITTSDEYWIVEWENFFNINWIGLTLEERRSVLLSMVLWRDATLSVLKQVVYWVVWGDSSSVEFYETRTDWVSTWDDLFTYEIIINSSLITNAFNPSTLAETIYNLQPAHCTVTISNTSYPTFTWSSGITPSASPMYWVSETLPFDWSIWS